MKSKVFSLGIFSLVLTFQKLEDFEISASISLKVINYHSFFYGKTINIYLMGLSISLLHWNISVSATARPNIKQNLETSKISDGGEELKLSDFPPEWGLQELEREEKRD